MAIILLSLFVIYPIYFIFTGKSCYDTKFIEDVFTGDNIEYSLEWFYKKLL